MIVLDTHAWLWWTSGSTKLSIKAKETCDTADALLVSAISLWEVAMLVSRDRLGLDRDVDVWLRQALALPQIRLEPLSPSIAVQSTRLPGEFHGDPADRIIVATALESGATLVTRDKRIHSWGRVKTVW